MAKKSKDTNAPEKSEAKSESKLAPKNSEAVSEATSKPTKGARKSSPKSSGAKKTSGGKKSSDRTAQTQASGTATVSQYQMLQSPIITEKTSMMGSVGASTGARVAFRVPKTSTKTEIKSAVEAVFGVKVEKVRTLNVLGKVKRTSRSMGRQASFKKAYVTLKDGQTINLVEGL